MHITYEYVNAKHLTKKKKNAVSLANQCKQEYDEQ